MAIEQTLQERYIELLSKIDWNTTLQSLDLNPKAHGDHFSILCPKCDKQEGFFYPNVSQGSPRLECNRKNNCGYSEHILSHLNGGSFPEGEQWIEAVQKLSQAAGIPFSLEGSERPDFVSDHFLRSYWNFLRSRFPGSPAEAYVIQRGLDSQSDLFGFAPEDLKEVFQWAQTVGHSEEILIKYGIIKHGEHGKFYPMRGRLVGAFVDQKGKMHNLWGRDLTEKPKIKYMNLPNSDIAHKKSPYGAEWFKGGRIVITEGYLDCLAARGCGISAVASGTSCFPLEMFKSLSGITEVVVAFDNDPAGRQGTEKFIKEHADLKILSVTEGSMCGCKDLADLKQKEGIGGVLKAIEDAQEVLKTDTDKTKLDSSFGIVSREAVVSYYKNLPDGIDFGLRIQGEEIRFPCGGYTAIAAPTKHGKTLFLVNATYRALELNSELEAVFITLEELSHPIAVRFINRHVEQRLSSNNFRTLTRFYRNEGVGDELKYFDKSLDVEMFRKNEKDFFERFLNTGRLRIIDLSYDNGKISLLEVLRSKVEEIKNSFPKVRLIVIDYLQLLNVSKPGSKSREEVLKEVCLGLKDLAATTGLAIVSPVQFNRTVMSEDDLHPSSIGEGGSIERQCSLLLGMWNRTFYQFEGKKKLDKPLSNEIGLHVLLSRHSSSQQKWDIPYDGNLGKLDFTIAKIQTGSK